MPLSKIQSDILKLLARNRNPESYVAGVGVEISDVTGLAEKIAPLRIGPRLAETVPDFWR